MHASPDLRMSHVSTLVTHRLCNRAQEWAKAVNAGKMSKGDKLGPVDHNRVSTEYCPVNGSFQGKCSVVRVDHARVGDKLGLVHHDRVSARGGLVLHGLITQVG